MKGLDTATVEKDVENVYRAEISRLRSNATWASPHGTDGYAEWPKNVRLLLEAKYDVDLKARTPLCGVLGQVIFYVKKFEQSGEPLPNVLLVGDRSECLVLSTTAIKGFLDLNIDWSVAPSKGDPALTRALVDGVNILPYVYDVDGKFDFRKVIDKIETLAKGEQHTVHATESNLGAIFIYWRDRVFREGKGKQALSAIEQVDVFLRCLFQPTDVYLHPSKSGVLTVPGYPLGVLVDVDQYKSFFDHFAQGYKPSEVAKFLAMKDRLVEDDARRRQGAFFTPDLWVAEAHAEVDRVLGPWWRQECIVWDCAAGTANLTRDYRFGELISSTAERPDVNAMVQQGWGGRVFQYDFLNPDMESPFFAPEDGANTIPADVDARLRAAAKAGKRLVWFINPPYGTANNAGTKGTSKKGIAKTVVNNDMKDAKLGAPSQQLYAQFMFQCRQVAEQYGFKDYTVGIFCKPTFMSSGSFKPFRDWWYKSHSYQGGFLFQASHFADVSGAWGISFTVWNSGSTTPTDADLPIRLTDVQEFTVKTNGIKAVYNSDGREASKWVREPVKGMKSEDAPQMSSGLKVVGNGYGSVVPDAFGYVQNKGNNVMENGNGVSWMSSTYANGHGLSVLPSNWRRAVALYAARKLVTGDWANDKDEYLTPDESKPGYEQWVDDCHIYALLHPSNNCTSMRDVAYKGKSWRIKNHWFWLTRDQALKALDTTRTHQTHRDAKGEPRGAPEAPGDILGQFGTNPNEATPWDASKAAGDPYFAHLLEQGLRDRLSPDARHVLDLLDALWLKSLPMRETYYASRPIDNKHPDLHLHAWDAGVYQLKHLWKGLYSEEWAELQKAHRALADRLRSGVYDYGFLKR